MVTCRLNLILSNLLVRNIWSVGRRRYDTEQYVRSCEAAVTSNTQAARDIAVESRACTDNGITGPWEKLFTFHLSYQHKRGAGQLWG
jgi:hypothetical protein